MKIISLFYKKIGYDTLYGKQYRHLKPRKWFYAVMWVKNFIIITIKALLGDLKYQKQKRGKIMDSSEFICKCKKQKGWITEGQITEPCPECGRYYKGKYSKKELTIKAIEQEDNQNE